MVLIRLTILRKPILILRSYVEYIQLVSDLRLGTTDDRIEAMLASVFGTDDLNCRDGQGQNPTTCVQSLIFVRPRSDFPGPFSSPPPSRRGSAFSPRAGRWRT